MFKRFLAPALVGLGLVLSSGACSTPADHHVVPVTTAPAVDRAALRAELAQHRLQQIDRLHAYADSGQFPRNTKSDTPLHMFKDPEGHLCAVANLVFQDGRDDLVEDTALSHNDVVLADVHEGPLHEWMLRSGLTQEEVARIQAPAMRVTDLQLLQKPQPRALVAAKKPPPANAKPDTAAVSDREMQNRLRAHFAEVEAELRANTDKSLDLALDRLAARATEAPKA